MVCHNNLSCLNIQTTEINQTGDLDHKVFQTLKFMVCQLTFFENLGGEGVKGVELKGVEVAIGVDGEEEH